MSETESLLIAARTKKCHKANYVKAKIEKTQENNKCWLGSEKDEMVNHILSEYSNMARNECKTRHE